MRFGVIGCGYVGMSFAMFARRRGFEVTGTTTSPMRLQELCDVVDHPRICRAGDPSADFSFLDQLDGLLIAIAPTDSPEANTYENVFASGVSAIVDAISKRRSQKPLHVTYLSSAGVYGDQSGKMTNELSLPDRSDPTNSLLVAAEESVLSLNSKSIQACVLRLGGIYGPGKDIQNHIKSAAGQHVAKNGNHRNAWVHLFDIISGVFFCYDRKLDGIFNLVDEMQMSRRELANSLCEQDGLPPVIWENHDRPGTRIFNARVSNDRIKSHGFKFKVPSMMDQVPV